MLETEIVLEQVGQTWQNAEVNELDKYVDMEPVQNGRASKMDITRVIKEKNIKPYKTSRLMFFFELQVDENVLFILEVVVAKQVLHKTSLMDCDMPLKNARGALRIDGTRSASPSSCNI